VNSAFEKLFGDLVKNDFNKIDSFEIFLNNHKQCIKKYHIYVE